MSSKSGVGNIKTNLRKVKPGPDQAFTLPKGTSAAPIKQVGVKPKTYKDTAVHKESIKIQEKLGLRNKTINKGTNPYDLADWKQGIKYPASTWKPKK